MMRANDLFEEIHSGTIKNGTDIRVIYKGELVDTIKYDAGMLKWGQGGEFSTKYLCDIETEFEVEKEIDIQNIPELKLSSTPTKYEVILHDLVKAVKQLDNKINTKE